VQHGFVGSRARIGSARPPTLLRLQSQPGLQRKEQGIIFINRRGYAPVLMCTSCGGCPQRSRGQI
jgi:primosomal protein N' (replication factor Y)